MTAAPTLAAGGADASSRVLHRSLAIGMPMATHAQGNYLYMSDGSRVLDASGGAAVVSVGHGVPEIVSAVSKQVGTLPYVSSAVFGIEPAEDLAKRMCEESGMARAIFLSGGSEAVESALKLCRQYHVENGQPARTKFISREISYHGNTMGALALGRHNRRRKLYLPLMPEGVFHSVSACNAWRFKTPGETDEAYVQRLADELDAKITELGAETVAAFFAEPVVGAASGCVPFVPGYLRAMKRVCERHGVLFCLDEIMCGAGRSGKMHAWMHDGDEARPDVQTLGKGLCGGYAPLSAVLVGERVVEVMKKGTGAFVNGYTFQSSGTGTAAGLAVYDYIHKHKL
jgi:adenosylmethionine-8-amino-7-oxononanoate aminotransferase